MSVEIDFEEIEAVSSNGLVKVTLEYIGEGVDGDYDEDNPDDVPLLRVSLSRKNDGHENLEDVAEHDNDDWWAVTDGSYCTMLPATTDRELLKKAAKVMLKKVQKGLSACVRNKRLYESLSYFDLENIESK